MSAQNITILYPPSIDYRFMYQRPQQLMKAFAELGCNVIYVNPAQMYPQAVPVERPFAHLPNFQVVQKDVNYQHLLHGKVVLWLTVAFHYDKADMFQPDLTVFDSVDNPEEEFSMWKKYLPLMESRADIIFATAQLMYRRHKLRRNRVYLLPNAADFDHFKCASRPMRPRPADLPPTGGEPLVGYFGAIYKWLDLSMIHKIAASYPVVLIGANKIFNLPIRYPNVTVLPMKDYADLPRYLSWFDCAIIPFKLTKMTKGCDPIKFYEYLSAGKPVVASDLPELKRFAGLYYPANGANASQVVAQALAENSEANVRKRQQVARDNTWRQRAALALQVIKNVLN
ncbi:MAG: glycosyltransferase [Thermoanaerobacteraceae bacterium]|nr:glycosyltransferase [Thermoanaerobacteraceae bacterium]